MTTKPKTAKAQQTRIKALVRFYERRGWDWISACGFECVQAMKANAAASLKREGR